MSSGEFKFTSPIWADFDGESFQDLIVELLTAEGFIVEPSGVGPDGGVDIFATEVIHFGINNQESFVWAVQCKFTSKSRAISPKYIGEILNTVSDERFRERKITGYILATNGRLSANMMSQLRGLNNKIPGFKTSYIDRLRLHTLLVKHPQIFKKFLPRLKVLHLIFGQASYGGIETYIEGIKKYSKHIHLTKPILIESKNFPSRLSYPSEYSIFKYAASSIINELKSSERQFEQVGRVFSNVLKFFEEINLDNKKERITENLRREIEDVLSQLGSFDLIHSHFFLPAYLAQKNKLKIIFTSHSLLSRDFLEEDNIVDSIQCSKDEEIYYSHINNQFVLSKAHQNEVLAVSGEKPLLFTSIFNLSDFEDSSIINLSKTKAKKELKLSNKFTLLFLGRSVYRKGLDILFEALNQLDNEKFQLVIVGSGFKLDTSKSILQYESGGINRVISVKINCKLAELPPADTKDYRKKIILHYKAADVVVCPSLYEPFGYVNLEAMAAGRPVIASDVDGIPEYIQNNKTGLLFSCGNVNDLKDKIRLLYENKKLMNQLGKNGLNSYKIILIWLSMLSS